MGKLLASPARLLGTLLCMTIAGFAATAGWDLYQANGIPQTISGADLYVYDPEGVDTDDFDGFPESTLYLCSISQFGQDYRDEKRYSYVLTEPVVMYGFADPAGAQAIGFALQTALDADICAIGQTFSDTCGYAAGDKITLTDADGESFDLTVTEVFPDDGSAVMVTTPEISERMSGTEGYTAAFVDVADDAQVQAFLDKAAETLPGADAAVWSTANASPILLYLAAGVCALVFSLLGGLLSWELLEIIGAPAGALAGAMLWQAVRPAVLWQLFWYGFADGNMIDSLPESVPLAACLVTAAVGAAFGCLLQLLVHKRLRIDIGQRCGSLAIAAGVGIITAGGSLMLAGTLETQCYDPLRADVIVQNLQGTAQGYAFLRDLPEIKELEVAYESLDILETEDAFYSVWLYPSETDTMDMNALSLDKTLAREMHLKPGDKVELIFRADSDFPIKRRMTVTAYAETPGLHKGGGIAVCQMLYRELYGENPSRIYLNTAVETEQLTDVLNANLRGGEQIRQSANILCERHTAQRIYILAALLLLIYIGVCIVIAAVHPTTQTKEDKL